MTPQASAVLDQARAWALDDPDPVTRAELTELIDQADRGDAAVLAELADRFSGLLEFGTAGLRGALGAGPNRMNTTVVRRAAAGLVAYLQQTLGRTEVSVVIGYDARHRSADFAQDSAAVITAAGGRALVLPRALPTPVLAFAVGHLGADAGVMVTASHNPPQDNGYKVYLGDGCQIVPPADAQISQAIDQYRTAAAVPLASAGWAIAGEDVVQAYLDAASAVLTPGGPRQVRLVHTSLHGVGHDVVQRAFAAAGFPAPDAVPSQAEPDPDFPTVPFPNPEEPGAMDAALELARRNQPDAVIANDPDADRCAVAVHDPAVQDWRMLRGDEVGALLGWRALQQPDARSGVLACSIVSSQLLAAMAAAAGVRHRETLTGFKWIGRVPELLFGYEEALGYCVQPQMVRDKDGVTAALAIAELVARLAQQDATLLDVLDDLALAHGVHATDAFSVRVADPTLITAIMDRLRRQAPTTLGGHQIVQADDLALGAAGLPPTEGLRYRVADGSRVIVRPSGTEPKLKVYLEAVVAVRDGDLTGARTEAARRLAALRADLEHRTHS